MRRGKLWQIVKVGGEGGSPDPIWMGVGWEERKKKKRAGGGNVHFFFRSLARPNRSAEEKEQSVVVVPSKETPSDKQLSY